MSCKRNPKACCSKPKEYSLFEKPIKLVQSPIDIKDLIPKGFSSPLVFKNFDVFPTDLKLKNNGYTVVLSGNWPGHILNRPSITKGPLENELYLFDKLHFHWPSEHKYNGNGFALEMHGVFYNSKYGSFPQAVGKRNGVTVLAIFYDQKTNIKNDYNIEQITEYLSELIDPGLSIEVFPFYLRDILNNEMGFTSGYAFYGGSLTTKPFTENINWLVSLKPGYLTDEQEALFKELCLSSNERNAREIQDRNDREVYLVVEKHKKIWK